MEEVGDELIVHERTLSSSQISSMCLFSATVFAYVFIVLRNLLPFHTGLVMKAISALACLVSTESAYKGLSRIFKILQVQRMVRALSLPQWFNLTLSGPKSLNGHAMVFKISLGYLKAIFIVWKASLKSGTMDCRRDSVGQSRIYAVCSLKGKTL